MHEAYLRLVNQTEAHWHNRAHFFAVAGQLIRRILVDHAREKGAQKRAGKAIRTDFEEALRIPAARDVNLVALDDALDELAAMDPRKARVVEMRYFAGLSLEEIGAVMGVSPTTVKRDWTIAKGWLYQNLSGGKKE